MSAATKARYCAYDGTKGRYKDGRCKACGRVQVKAERDASGFNGAHSLAVCPDLANHHNHATIEQSVISLRKDFETILDAAEEGFRNCESDADNGVKGAAESLKRYGDAFASIEAIRNKIGGGKS